MSSQTRIYHALTCTDTVCDPPRTVRTEKDEQAGRPGVRMPGCPVAAARSLRFLDRVQVWADDAWHPGTVISVGPSRAGIIAGLRDLPEGSVRIAVKAQDADEIGSTWTITHDLTDPEVAGCVRLAESVEA